MDRIPGLIVKGCVAAVFSFALLLALFRKDVLVIVKQVFNRG